MPSGPTSHTYGARMPATANGRAYHETVLVRVASNSFFFLTLCVSFFGARLKRIEERFHSWMVKLTVTLLLPRRGHFIDFVRTRPRTRDRSTIHGFRHAGAAKRVSQAMRRVGRGDVLRVRGERTAAAGAARAERRGLGTSLLLRHAARAERADALGVRAAAADATAARLREEDRPMGSALYRLRRGPRDDQNECQRPWQYLQRL